MIASNILSVTEELILVQDEPGLDLALPHTFRQPPKPIPFTRGRSPIPHLVRQALEARRQDDPPGFGAAYGELVVEFQPALKWAWSCWDYLLTTEGCRFVPRDLGERRYHRSEYRAVLEPDFSRLVHKTFKECLAAYDPAVHGPSFIGHLRQALWPAVLAHYRQLDQPEDPRQRRLTGLSYLRCVPYQFLNDYHHELVHHVVRALPAGERKTVEQYHLRFQTPDAAGIALQLSPEEFGMRKDRALQRLKRRSVLAYHLLRQIERY